MRAAVSIGTSSGCTKMAHNGGPFNARWLPELMFLWRRARASVTMSVLARPVFRSRSNKSIAARSYMLSIRICRWQYRTWTGIGTIARWRPLGAVCRELRVGRTLVAWRAALGNSYGVMSCASRQRTHETVCAWAGRRARPSAEADHEGRRLVWAMIGLITGPCSLVTESGDSCAGLWYGHGSLDPIASSLVAAV